MLQIAKTHDMCLTLYHCYYPVYIKPWAEPTVLCDIEMLDPGFCSLLRSRSGAPAARRSWGAERLAAGAPEQTKVPGDVPTLPWVTWVRSRVWVGAGSGLELALREGCAYRIPRNLD